VRSEVRHAGPARFERTSLRWICALAACAQAAATASHAQAASGESAPNEVAGVVVTAPAGTVPGITPERSYDRDALSAHGDDTVGKLVGQIAAQRGDGDEPPVVLVNGKLVADLADIGDFPAEAVSRLDVLPRGSGTRFGASSTRRVYNIALQHNFRSQIASISGATATEGDWSSKSGTANFTRIRGTDRLNVHVSASESGSLLESQRHVLQPASDVPYALRGNIVPDPGAGSSEIDPALSALAGRPVYIAGVPASATHTLADFAATADHPNVTDLGRFRTLVPKSRTIDFGVEGARQLSEHLNASLNARVDASDSTALSGLPSGLFLLPATSPYSPFSRDVGMALYAAQPLSHHSDSTKSGVNAALSADLGRWQGQLTGSYDRSVTHTDATVQASQPTGVTAVLSPSLGDPFARAPSDLIPLASNSTASTASTAGLQLLLMGQPLDLPAGPIHVTVGAGWSENRLSGSSSNFGSIEIRSNRGTLAHQDVTAEIPVTSPSQGPIEVLGDLSLNLGYGVSEVSGVGGALHHSSYGLLWAPRDWLHVTAGRNEIQTAPSLLLEDAPVSVTSGVRFFDVVTGQTADVTMVTGGDPNLVPQRERADHAGVTLTPLQSINLQLRADYFAVTDYNALAGLPPTSAAVMAAFPGRFVRGSSGQLTLVDFRPINLDQQRKDRCAWGFDFDAPLGANAARLQFSFNHTYYLRNDIEVRPGLPTVDLLKGGALGSSGDGARHLLDFNLGVSKPGRGIELTGAWRSESFLQTGSATEGALRFDPSATLGLRVFADVGSLIPHAPWAKGARITFIAENLTDARQRVVDASGATPLQYQAPYLDAIGRKVGIQLRNSF
jgi:hypothetical protein